MRYVCQECRQEVLPATGYPVALVSPIGPAGALHLDEYGFAASYYGRYRTTLIRGHGCWADAHASALKEDATRANPSRNQP